MQQWIMETLASWLRSGLAALSAVLVAKGVLTADQGSSFATNLLNDIVMVLPAVLSAIWSAISKYQSRTKLATALALPKGSTEADVQAAIKAGDGISPAKA